MGSVLGLVGGDAIGLLLSIWLLSGDVIRAVLARRARFALFFARRGTVVTPIRLGFGHGDGRARAASLGFLLTKVRQPQVARECLRRRFTNNDTKKTDEETVTTSLPPR